ncbi:hypothetical protein BJ170DRAFT_597889 [Xylariales sp. AK1849]|nr:hypothetical protein BJ170DRAFT_597889 [Xylariales sp. AK1849]
MKFSTTIASCLIGIAAAAPAPQGSGETDQVWEVTALEASAEPHGTITQYVRPVQPLFPFFSSRIQLTTPSPLSFSLNITTLNQTAVCTGTGSSYQVLGDLLQTACDPAAFSFAWTTNGSNATLELWDADAAQHAVHLISADEIVWENEVPNPNGAIQVYEGPSNFSVQTEAD